MGAKKNTKGRVERQPQPPPPAGYSDGKVSRQRRGKPPASARYAAPAPVPLGFNPGDARGEAPCIKITLNLPLPRRGRGVGGMGAEKNTKDRGGRRQSRQAPCRVQQPRAATTGEFFRPEQVPAEVPSMIHSGKVLRGSGDSFKSPPAFLRRPPAFFFLHRKKKLAISGRMCYNKHTSGAAGTGGASSRKAEGKEEPS